MGKDSEALKRSFNEKRFMWLRLVQDDMPRLSGMELRFAYVIWDLLNYEKGYAFPTLDILAERLKTDKRHVTRLRASLTKRGWINYTRTTGRGKAGEYRLSFGSMEEESSKKRDGYGRTRQAGMRVPV